MSRLVFFLIAILAVAVGLLLGTLNADSVTLDLLWVQLQWPLGLLLLIFFSSGLILGFILIYLNRVLPLQYRLRKLSNTRNEEPGKSLSVDND